MTEDEKRLLVAEETTAALDLVAQVKSGEG